MSRALRQVSIKGFRSLFHTILDLGRLTVLVGANGSGKSNVLDAFRLAATLRTGSLQRFVGERGGASTLLHYGPKATLAIELVLRFQGEAGPGTYAARLGFAQGDRLMFLDEQIGSPSALEALGAGHWESAAPSTTTKVGQETLAALSGIYFYHFHDTSPRSALRTNSRLEDDQILQIDGGNLASFLARLERSDRQDDQAAWKRINLLARRVAPGVKALSPVTEGSSVRLDWIDDQDQRFGVHQLSDGTLRAIALIAALAQPSRLLPLLMCIDEPELGLHPAAIGIIAELSRSISYQTQVLFASQSTVFIDQFEAEELVVVEREAGRSVLTRPDPSLLADWLADYSLSETFQKGVLGGQP